MQPPDPRERCALLKKPSVSLERHKERERETGEVERKRKQHVAHCAAPIHINLTTAKTAAATAADTAAIASSSSPSSTCSVDSECIQHPLKSEASALIDFATKYAKS